MVQNATVAPILQEHGDQEDDACNDPRSIPVVNDDPSFPVKPAALTRHPRDVVYLNNASMARLSESVQQIGKDSLSRPPWESTSDATASQSEVRALFADILECDATRIAIHPSTAFAITMAAHNVWRVYQQQSLLLSGHSGGQRLKTTVVVMENEFPSAVYPWQELVRRSHGALRLRIVPQPEHESTGHASSSSWTSALRRHLDASVLAACLSPLHWATGATVDLTQLRAQCQQHNIRLIVDATQACGIYPCSVKEIQPDMLCCSVHKWLRGPLGTSLVYIHPQWQQLWEPLDQHGRGRFGGEHWDAYRDKMDAHGYHAAFLPDARKFDAGGKVHPMIMPMLAEALRTVVRVDVQDAQARLAELWPPLIEWCQRKGFRVSRERCQHLVGMVPNGWTVERMVQVAEDLVCNEGILLAVKCGNFRISPYLDNSVSDILRLIEALDRYC